MLLSAFRYFAVGPLVSRSMSDQLTMRSLRNFLAAATVAVLALPQRAAAESPLTLAAGGGELTLILDPQTLGYRISVGGTAWFDSAGKGGKDPRGKGGKDPKGKGGKGASKDKGVMGKIGKGKVAGLVAAWDAVQHQQQQRQHCRRPQQR